ncbi:Na(+)/dicarboxylate cotransporter 3-like isoform X2 [Ptychodera flava]|uniref:Na(+)/dicarboxylate cotransporter 3-like isoform X2 n=1 Tax=Ptychodera flava TaxID=63121 RepID=UPI00396A625B
MTSCKDALRYLYFKRNILILLLTPLLLSPLLIIHYESQASRCAFVLAILAVLWTTQAVPLQVTGLIPLFMYPLFGVLTMADVCTFYMVEFHVLFVAIMVIASAIQRYGLHRRIALRALLLAGSDPKRLLLALMIVTGFLSMWIVNLAVVSMIVPIVVALVDQLSTSCTEVSEDEKESDEEKKHCGITFPLEAVIVDSSDQEEERGNVEVEGIPNQSMEILTKIEKAHEENQKNIRQDLTTCFNLGLVYSATMGGAASLVGNPMQLIMNANLEIYYNSEAKISFGNWMLFAAPIQLASLLLGWAWLSLFYLDLKYVLSSTITTGVALICFILPSKKPKIDILDEKPYTGLLEWKSAEAMIPWGLLIYVGGIYLQLKPLR